MSFRVDNSCTQEYTKGVNLKWTGGEQMQNVLRETRQKKGMTISELSRLSGVSRQTIYKIEANPQISITSVVMEALAAALGVKANKIFLM